MTCHGEDFFLNFHHKMDCIDSLVSICGIIIKIKKKHEGEVYSGAKTRIILLMDLIILLSMRVDLACSYHSLFDVHHHFRLISHEK